MLDLKRYGYIAIEPTPDGQTPGRVTNHRGSQYIVITERGEVTAELKGLFHHRAEAREDFPCVGDFVFIHYNDSGPSLITELLPRRSKFSRADLSGHGAGYAKVILEQVVAANFDYVFIVTSLNRDFKVSRIARYLTQALQSGGQPVVILTKADLVSDCDAPISDVLKAAPSVPVHAVSAHTGFGMSALDAYLKPEKTVVFLGMSGVGKSSLLNALIGHEITAVKAIREDDDRGRHTTTHRELFMLPMGAMVIDTPGMRELGLYGADEGISAGFYDVEELFARCRFSDCGHQTEPGCAIATALDDGTLARERWESYLAQKQENRYVDDKAVYLSEKQAWAKSIARSTRKMKKSGAIRR